MTGRSCRILQKTGDTSSELCTTRRAEVRQAIDTPRAHHESEKSTMQVIFRVHATRARVPAASPRVFRFRRRWASISTSALPCSRHGRFRSQWMQSNAFPAGSCLVCIGWDRARLGPSHYDGYQVTSGDVLHVSIQRTRAWLRPHRRQC
jgi:hypothetical protein